MNRRRQALQFCLDSAIVVIVQIINEFLLEVLHNPAVAVHFKSPSGFTVAQFLIEYRFDYQLLKLRRVPFVRFFS